MSSFYLAAGCCLRSGLCAVEELSNCLPGTEAKFITAAHVTMYRPDFWQCIVEPTPPVKMTHQIKPLPFVFTLKYLNDAKKMSTAK